MDSMQQQPKDMLKIVLLFSALGISTYVMYKIGRSLEREISGNIL